MSDETTTVREYSIRTRIKTVDQNTLRKPQFWSESIPLEQGLRLRSNNSDNDKDSVREYSIRTRIKTNAPPVKPKFSEKSESIPLEQGLRLMKTSNFLALVMSESIPLEQGLRQAYTQCLALAH